jgi:tetratricopeptide (TPR) repeat protein
VARALRPETAHELAHALESRGSGDEAVLVFRDLTRLQPENDRHWICLGRLLKERGDRAGSESALEKALAKQRESIRLQPDHAQAHGNLGEALAVQGKLSEAIAAYREAIRLKPDLAGVHLNLGSALIGQGQLAEAIAECRAAIRLQPDLTVAHYNLGIALNEQGKLAEGNAAYREAIRLQPDYAEAHCNLAEVLRKQGKFSESLAESRRGHELGSKRSGWSYPSAQWVHEAERLVALQPRLPALYRGDDKPKDAAEALDFARCAYYTQQFGLSARLYTESFRSEPRLAEDMKAQNRYNAACALALAGTGKPAEKPPLDEAAKARWRKQALDWLKADLTYWSKQAQTGKPEDQAEVGRTLRHWKYDFDLAGIRDEEGMKALAEDEQTACRALWAEVDEVLKQAGL